MVGLGTAPESLKFNVESWNLYSTSGSLKGTMVEILTGTSWKSGHEGQLPDTVGEEVDCTR